MSNVDLAIFHKTYPCWLLLEYAFVSSSSLVCAIVVAMVVYVLVEVEIFVNFHFYIRTKVLFFSDERPFVTIVRSCTHMISDS